MKKAKPHLPSHFDIYHQSDTLLFQFTLSEFLSIYQKIEKLQGSHSKKEIENIAGSIRHQTRIFSWHSEDSPLAKLKNYCAYFSQNTEVPKTLRAQLRKLANSLWLAGIETLDFIHDSLTADQTDLSTMLKRLLDISRAIAPVIFKIIMQYSHDENILFFLLKNHENFDLVYGEQSTMETFKKMFSSLEKSEKFLLMRYRKRHFHPLLTQIQSHFSELCS